MGKTRAAVCREEARRESGRIRRTMSMLTMATTMRRVCGRVCGAFYIFLNSPVL